ncbi:STAS domain-containing protein [Sorangium sp. So ce726]|uniref:STAS domain-containing protein n=1 Tax=Sorangium sp. So ce726 TaxID=3133319 RepID=UPI003F634F2A
MGYEGDDERAQLVRRLEAMEQEMESLRADARRWRALMTARCLSVSIHHPVGKTHAVNAGWEALWRAPAEVFLQMNYNMLEDAQLVENGIMPHVERFFRGEEVAIPPISYDTDLVEELTGKKGGAVWVCSFGVPVHDAGDGFEGVLFQFAVPEAAEIQHKYEALIEEQRTLQASLEARNRELEETVRVIAAQRDAIQAMSVPVIRVADGVLCLPIVGMIDDARASMLLERLLEAIAAQQAAQVLLDITGVPALDARAAAQLVGAASAARLLGASCTLVGVSPALAQTLVELGVDLGGLDTAATLAEGLTRALAARRGAAQRSAAVAARAPERGERGAAQRSAVVTPRAPERGERGAAHRPAALLPPGEALYRKR